MKSYNPKGPKSIVKSVKGIRALHDCQNAHLVQNLYNYVLIPSNILIVFTDLEDFFPQNTILYLMNFA